MDGRVERVCSRPTKRESGAGHLCKWSHDGDGAPPSPLPWGSDCSGSSARCRQELEIQGSGYTDFQLGIKFDNDKYQIQYQQMYQ